MTALVTDTLFVRIRYLKSSYQVYTVANTTKLSTLKTASQTVSSLAHERVGHSSFDFLAVLTSLTYQALLQPWKLDCEVMHKLSVILTERTR